VHIFDAEGQPYHWANTDFGNLPAPQAHWVGSVPPGCYVVQAEGKDAQGRPLQTDHAIVEVSCDGHACVRLFVPGDSGKKPPDLDLLRFSVAPSEVKSGATWKGHAIISGPAPAGGVDIDLSSSDPSVAGVQPTAHVQGGATNVTFTAPPTNNQTRQPVEVTITATLGATQKSAKLRVLPTSK
jgi:hypothetical protein